MQWLRRSFITGFFVTVPLFISVVAFIKIFNVVDGLTTPMYDRLLGRRIPGLGTASTAAALVLVGALARNVIGLRVLQRAESWLLKVPVFRTIYAPVKQLIAAFSPDNVRGFKRVVLCSAILAMPRPALAAEAGQPQTQAASAPSPAGGEANLVLPDLSTVEFHGVNGRTLLMGGLTICALGLLFGLATFVQLKNLPVHASMLEVSELIYETCKTYLVTQGKFILLLELFIGTIVVMYYGLLEHLEPLRVIIIVLFSLVGIAGSYGVAWFGIRVNTFANSRAAFASLRGKPFPIYAIPLRSGMSIGMLLISVELLLMLCI